MPETMSDSINQTQFTPQRFFIDFIWIVRELIKNMLSKKCRLMNDLNAMILIDYKLRLINSMCQLSVNQQVKDWNNSENNAEKYYVKNAINCIFVLTLTGNKCYL